MSVGFVDYLNFEKQMPVHRNLKNIAIAVPCTSTSAGEYQLGSYFMMNVPRSVDHVFDPMNTFLCFQAYITDGTGTGSLDLSHSYSCDSFFQHVKILQSRNMLEVIDDC